MVWRRPKQAISWLTTLADMAQQHKVRLTGTWHAVTRQAMLCAGGEASLVELYEIIEKNASDRFSSNQNWKAKIRQIIQIYNDFERVERGVWRLA